MLLFPHFAWIAQLVEHFPEEEGVVGSIPTPSTDMFQKIFLWIQTYERHLSALAMVGGFIADNLLFDRIDVLQTQLVFLAYTAICFVSIPLLHWFETRASRKPRWRFILPLATQFALGGFWSGFVIFYWRSADLGASWPFLLFLFLTFLANEYFAHYHDRVVFTSLLFFFALYSYAIFAVPIYTGSIGTVTFLESGALAVLIFFGFIRLLRVIGRERFSADLRHIRIGAAIILVLMNAFYFTNILPPLPLAATAAGVYHSVSRIPGNYLGTTEAEPWTVRYLGFAPTLHIVNGESLSAYSSVFAPTTLRTSIVHRWQRYDPLSKKWIQKARIAYPIIGGRDGGYRGYSTVPIDQAGKWRVSIETIDGRRITELPFTAVLVTAAPPQEAIILP
jgi:hypothetical protein